jgi:hypothetical protein
VPISPGAEDIRDIRPPYHISPDWLWLAWMTGSVGLAAVGYGLWRWRHWLPGLRPKLPFELALAQLEAARELMRPEHAREFSICVSETVRTYIEVRFAIRAAHRTTEEFLHNCLAESPASLTDHRDLLAAFLHHCDLAKFARWVLSVPEMETMLQSASNFVCQTGKTENQNSKQSPADSDAAGVPSSPPGTSKAAKPGLKATRSHPSSVPTGAHSSPHPLPL